MNTSKADGALDVELADKTSSLFMQTAMQMAGMSTQTVANTVNTMMGMMQ